MEMRPSLPIITPPRASAWSLLASTHLATTCKNSCRSPAGIVDADQVTLVDRLIHRAEVIEIDGESYRLKEAKEGAAERRRRRKAK